MKHTQIKIAYGLGVLNELVRSGINPQAFCKVAAKSQDPTVQKLAAAAHMALRQMAKLTNTKQASKDTTFRHFNSVYSHVMGQPMGEAFQAVKTAAENTDVQISAGLASYCLDSGFGAYLHSYKTAAEAAEEEMPAFLQESGDEESGAEGEEEDEGEDEEGDGSDKSAEEMAGGEATMDPAAIAEEIKALVEAGEISPDQAEMLMEEISSGVELGA